LIGGPKELTSFKFAYGAYLLFSYWALGMVLENRRWAWKAEFARYLLGIPFLYGFVAGY
jgi:hypothetical protein